jgi:isocitrate dehydrogenase (NAD+)
VERPTVVVMKGDQTGQELLEEALRVLDPSVTGAPLTFAEFDLSLEQRRATGNRVVLEAAHAMRRCGFGLKAATITPEQQGDVGSPNAILRREIEGTVIIRTGRRLPGVAPLAGVSAPIAVVRMATEDAYEAKEWVEGVGEEVRVFRTTYLSWRNCRAAAEFSFMLARKLGATVFGGPKWTVSPTYEGLLKKALDEASRNYPDVRYEPQLIDAAYALLLTKGDQALVMPSLNRDGDILSDLVLQMYGSIAGSESLLISFDQEFRPRVVMAEAPHGTAPSLQGKNVANSLAMILAGAALLSYMPADPFQQAARAIQEASFEALYAGIRTHDLGGDATTTEFTDEVIRRVRQKREAWAVLGRR